MPRPLDIVTNVSDEGKINDTYRRIIAESLRMYAGSPVRLRLSPPRRSSRANAYYWAGIIQPIQVACADAGRAVSGQALHEYFKQKYLPVETANVNGLDVVIPFSTSRLDSTSFSDFIESIRTDELVLELGVYFDDPQGLKSFKIEEM